MWGFPVGQASTENTNFEAILEKSTKIEKALENRGFGEFGRSANDG